MCMNCGTNIYWSYPPLTCCPQSGTKGLSVGVGLGGFIFCTALWLSHLGREAVYQPSCCDFAKLLWGCSICSGTRPDLFSLLSRSLQSSQTNGYKYSGAACRGSHACSNNLKPFCIFLLSYSMGFFRDFFKILSFDGCPYRFNIHAINLPWNPVDVQGCVSLV